MFNFITARWSFLVCGILLGFLGVLCLYLFENPPELTQMAENTFGYCNQALNDGELSNPGGINFVFALLIGLVVGSLCGALVNSEWKFKFFFEECSGSKDKIMRTLGLGIIGGLLIMIGSFIAGNTLFGQFVAAVQGVLGGWLYLISALVSASFLSILLSSRE